VSVTLSLIVAMTKNRVIGHHNKMPWHLPAELQYFKRITMGHPIIMGRKTYDSIGRPLPGRRNIVVTRNQDFSAPGIDVVHSLREAIAACGGADAFITGGAALYAEALPLVDRLYITEIDATLEGDTFFPALNPVEWQEISRDERPRDAANRYDVALTVLDRRRSA
jgi:dihydrofolate reductase